MQVSGQVETVKMAMAAESPGRKLSFLIQGIIWTVLFSTMGGIYISNMVNANSIDNAFCGGDSEYSKTDKFTIEFCS